MLLNGKTPYEILYGMSPNYEYLRTFGCMCYARSLRHDNDKSGDRSRRCIFVGYPFGQKGWRVYDLESGEYFVLRDDVFSKTEFPYAAHNEAQIAVGSSQTEEVAVDDDLQDGREEIPADRGSSSDVATEATEAAVTTKILGLRLWHPRKPLYRWGEVIVNHKDQYCLEIMLLTVLAVTRTPHTPLSTPNPGPQVRSFIL